MRGFAAIGLYYPKTPANVGSVLRAAHCFQSSLVVIEGERYRKAPTDVTSAWKQIPLLHGKLFDLIPHDCIPVAVDLVPSARPLAKYTHPERAFYIFGPEDGILGKNVLSWCRDVVMIPTFNCLNLAACVNVVLYDRLTKRMEK